MSIEFYEKNAQSYFDSTVDLDLSKIYSRFTNLLPTDARILDAGCGSGRDIKYFLSKGYRVDAFDASKEMAQLATQYTGIRIINSTFDSFTSKEKYNGIWACASLVHISREEIIRTLSNLCTHLDEDGVLYFSMKYKNEDREEDERRFTEIDDEFLKYEIKSSKEFELVDSFLTTDIRVQQSNIWINVLLKKNNTHKHSEDA